MTFLAVAERAGLAFSAYESTAEGRLELVERKFQFTAIHDQAYDDFAVRG